MADCDPIKFVPTSETFGGNKKLPNCVPEIPRKRDELHEPEGTVEEDTEYLLPPDINIYSRTVVVNCVDGNYVGALGDPVSVLSGAFSDILLWNSTGISEDVLNRIAKENLTEWVEFEMGQQTLTEAALVSRTGMLPSEAAELLRRLTQLQDVLTEAARIQAISLLSCYWENDVQTINCDEADPNRPDPADNPFARPEEHPDAVYQVVVPAGTFRSTASKNEANELALAQAKSLLNCFFVNDAQEVTCWDRPDDPSIKDPEDMELRNETEPPAEGLEPRVFRVVIPAGTIVSYIGKEDANELAREQGYALLVCYYVNDPILVSCEDPEARNIGVNPAENPPAHADITGRVPGQIVSVPTGAIVSLLGTKDATQQAQTLADSLMECCFMNREIYVECPPVELKYPDGSPVLDAQGNPVVVPASTVFKDAVPNVTIPAGKFTACVDGIEDVNQAYVDQLALTSAETALVCIYCNQAVLPTCVPAWVISAVQDGVIVQAENGIVVEGETIPFGGIYKIDLPLVPEKLKDPYTGETPDFSSWSLDATTGVAADTYCSQSLQQSQIMAESDNTTTLRSLIDSRDLCTYGNDLIIAACSAKDPYSDDPSNYHSGTLPSGAPYIFFTKYDQGVCLDPNISAPTPGEFIIIPENMITATPAEVEGTLDADDPEYAEDHNAYLTKLYVNDKAQEMALSMLTCMFSNRESIGSCWGPEGEMVCEGKWYFSAGKEGDGLTQYSHSADNPLVIPEATVTSMISLEDVYIKVRRMMLANLFCLYENSEQTATCDPGLEQLNTATVEAGAITASSKAEADNLARQMAEAMVACIEPSQSQPGPQGPPGPPGVNGTNANCKEACFGIYS